MRNAIKAGTFDHTVFFPEQIARRADLKFTLENALEAWLEENAYTWEPGTLKHYRTCIDANIRPKLGHKAFSRVTDTDVKRLIAQLVDRGLSPKWINNQLVPLRQVFKHAKAIGMLDRDPMVHVKNVKARRARPDPFSLEEMKAILNEIYDEQALNLYQTAFWTGMRIGELIALRWSDVDFDNGTIQVERTKSCGRIGPPKSATSERVIEMQDPAREALMRQRKYSQVGRVHGEVFLNPHTGEAWHSDKPPRLRHWAPALKRAGIRYRSQHHTRHTFASMMISFGEPPAWVAEQLGHADPGVMWDRYARYIHTYQKKQSRGAAKAVAAFTGKGV